mgnify:CR=1 FL=1|jgi:dUTP pyrophosphatase
MDVKIVKHKMYEETPSYAKDGDAGIDLMAVAIIKSDDKHIVYNTGIALEIPKGYVGLVFPRSSIRKKDLTLSNSVGVVDSGYRGEIQCTFLKNSCTELDGNLYEVGERICQLIIIPYPQINLIPVQRLSDSDRGVSGHGSTGN